MREWQSQSHVKWYCRYHVVFTPKYRKRAIFGSIRKGIGKILRELCEQERWSWWRVTRWRTTFTWLEAPSRGLHQTTRYAGGS